MVYKFCDEKSADTVVNKTLESKKQLTIELEKTIVRKIKKRTVYSRFKDIYILNNSLSLKVLVNMLGLCL